jgi:hypothetical protein
MKRLIICLCLLAVSSYMVAPAATAFVINDKTKLNGWIGAYYRGSEDRTVQDGFTVSYAWLSLSGQLDKNVSYSLGFNGASGTNTLVGTYIKYSGLPFNSNVTIGQFLVPFSPCVLTHPYRWTVVESPISSSLVSIYDKGVQIDSQLNDKVYGALAVINGTGLNTAEDNKSKDMVAMITLTPGNGLKLGMAYQAGSEPLSGSYLGHRIRSDLNFDYKLVKLDLSGEYVFQRRRLAAGGEEDAFSWHLTGTYDFVPDLQGVLQYRQYDPNQSVSTDRQDVIVLGCNYMYTDNCKLQANYRIRTEETPVNNNDFVIQNIISL